MKHLFKLSLLLLALMLPATASAYDFEVDGIYYYYIGDNQAGVTDADGSWYTPDYLGDVIIPETVTYGGTTYSLTAIGESAFEHCTGLTSVTIPNSVIVIGDNAFRSCSGLTSVDIPNSVTSIGDFAFEGCIGLTSVTIPNSVTSIGIQAFSSCSGLTSVTITDLKVWCNIQFSDEYSNPLYYAHHLYLNGSEVTDLIIPNTITSIGDFAFWGCSGLTSVTIPNTVTSIGRYAFYCCSVLASVIIPNSVTSIGDSSFERCSGLTSVTIPNSVTSIGTQAFSRCSGLTDVFSFIEAPTTVSMGSRVFYQFLTYAERTLHVPVGTVSAYQADTKWSQYFGSIVEMEPEPVLAESIKLNVTTVGLNEGATLQLTATVLPEDCNNKAVLWASNNPSIATVDSNGLVTTHGVGTATITAITTDGSNLSTTCTVTLLPVGVKGDVNGDSNISISDVTTLIDYLLMGHWPE